jgi:hypothetical protein
MDPCSVNGTMFLYECCVLSSYVLFNNFLELKISQNVIIFTSLINKTGCLLLLCWSFFGVVGGSYMFDGV